MNRFYGLTVAALLIIGCSGSGNNYGPFSQVTNTDLQMVEKHLGAGWQADARIVIPDINDLSSANRTAAPVAEMLAPAMKQLNVVSVYDLSASPPATQKADSLSVKILVFGSAQSAADFAAAKYDRAQSGFENLGSTNGVLTYRGDKYGKIAKFKDHLYVSVFRLNDASANDAIGADFLASL